ncbi:MAG: 1-phosphofructokinase family hexose kinase [Vicinamibacteria bacterium]
MILVVCPNLAVDYTMRVDKLRLGHVHRSHTYERQAGGKGVNTARALRALGQEPLICGFIGGESGRFIERGLAEEKLRRELVPIESESRTCVIVLSEDGEATVVNESGPTVTESDALMSLVATLIPGSDAVAMMGSLPPGMPSDSYAQIAKRCRDAEVPCLVDASGPTLESALKERPTYAKPNRAEAEELLGGSLSDEIAAAREIRHLGAEVVVLTLGDEGAVLSASGLEGRLQPPTLAPVNPTGAGDALAAGLLAGHLRGGSLREIATVGMAAATASVRHGYGRIRPSEVQTQAVRFEEL